MWPCGDNDQEYLSVVLVQSHPLGHLQDYWTRGPRDRFPMWAAQPRVVSYHILLVPCDVSVLYRERFAGAVRCDDQLPPGAARDGVGSRGPAAGTVEEAGSSLVDPDAPGTSPLAGGDVDDSLTGTDLRHHSCNTQQEKIVKSQIKQRGRKK